MSKNLRKIVITGVFSALSIVFVILIHFPIFPAVAFLEYDAADIPIFLINLTLGPTYAILMTIVVSIIQGITVSSASGIIGILMHIVATSTFIIFSNLTKKLLEKKFSLTITLIFATIAGIISMTVMMGLWNLIVTPFYMGVSINDILPLLPLILLFNLIKASVNGFIALVLRKQLDKLITKICDFWFNILTYYICNDKIPLLNLIDTDFLSRAAEGLALWSPATYRLFYNQQGANSW